MVKEAAAVWLLAGFELVDEPCKELALGEVSLLRSQHSFARRVVAHVMGRYFQAKAQQQRAHRLAIGDDPSAVGLQGSHNQIVNLNTAMEV